MPTFPLLKTGAVVQYPSGSVTGQASQVIRFLDGTDQRFMLQGRSLRAWQVHLNMLDEDELEALAQFFESQLGAYSSFVFPDPYTGAEVPSCRFGDDSFTTTLHGNDDGETSFWVLETYG
jgi:hypothetical protein